MLSRAQTPIAAAPASDVATGRGAAASAAAGEQMQRRGWTGGGRHWREPRAASICRPTGRDLLFRAGVVSSISTIAGHDLAERIRTFAANERCTPLDVLVAALAALLARHSSQTDIVLGSTAANRDFATSRRVIGPLANPMALRIDVWEIRRTGRCWSACGA